MSEIIRRPEGAGAVGSTRLVRPVTCHICGLQMHYAGQPEHVPEARVTVENDGHEEYFYVHAECWNARMAGPNDRGQAQTPDPKKGMKP
jgi:hypothetical protein